MSSDALELGWQASVGRGYIAGLSVRSDTLAAVGPKGDGWVHLFNAATGKPVRRILGGLQVQSVAFTEEGRLLFARGGRLERGQSPEIWLRRLDSDHVPLDDHKVTGDLPGYERELHFGKIVRMPGTPRAVIGGLSDRQDVRGFVLLADWSAGPERAEFRVVRTGIDEAPHDIALAGDEAYIATGRGSSVLAISLTSGEVSYRMTLPPNCIFKPMRVLATRGYIAVASYNELYWWSGDELIKVDALTSRDDCINGLATFGGDTVMAALTYSSSLKLLESPEAVPVLLRPERLRHPCHLVVDEEAVMAGGDEFHFYATEHHSGRIWALTLSMARIAERPGALVS